MSTWIALLRGINVGGRNKLPMKSLVLLLEGLGASNVRTYIQSGNAAFESPSRSSNKLGAAISEGIAAAHGFEPPTVVLKPAELERAARDNPFPDAAEEADGKTLHLLCLAAIPKAPDLDALEAAKHESESWKLVGRFMYLHTPSGFHKSKLAAKAERALGVVVTARNWRTTMKLLEMTR